MFTLRECVTLLIGDSPCWQLNDQCNDWWYWHCCRYRNFALLFPALWEARRDEGIAMNFLQQLPTWVSNGVSIRTCDIEYQSRKVLVIVSRNDYQPTDGILVRLCDFVFHEVDSMYLYNATVNIGLCFICNTLLQISFRMCSYSVRTYDRNKINRETM